MILYFDFVLEMICLQLQKGNDIYYIYRYIYRSRWNYLWLPAVKHYAIERRKYDQSLVWRTHSLAIHEKASVMHDFEFDRYFLRLSGLQFGGIVLRWTFMDDFLDKKTVRFCLPSKWKIHARIADYFYISPQVPLLFYAVMQMQISFILPIIAAISFISHVSLPADILHTHLITLLKCHTQKLNCIHIALYIL